MPRKAADAGVEPDEPMTGTLQVIARLPFRIATTMPEVPHQYTVRGKGGTEEDWRALAAVIRSDGVFERWRGRRNRYLYPGDGSYWDQPPYPIINRMRMENDTDRLRREAQPVRDAHGRIVG